MGRGRSGRTSRQRPAMTQRQRRRTAQDWMNYFDNAGDSEAIAALAEWRQERMDADNRSNDTDVQRFLHNIGWSDNVPEVMDEQQYQAALRAAGNPDQLYHADKPAGGATAQQFAEQYFGQGRDANGNLYRHYASNGYYGGGTYFADDATDSASYGTNQFRGFLNNKAKVIDSWTLQNDYTTYAASHPAFARMMNRVKVGYGGDGEKLSIFAAMRGYNVIKAGSYYVVLDRSATTVSRLTRSTRGLRRNW